MMEEQLDQIVGAFQALYGHSPAVVVRAPGRVNLLGEHVDYNEGWVMPAAIDRAAWLAVEAVAEPSVTLHAVDFGEYARFELNQLQPKGEPSAAHWIDYPAGVAWAMQTAGYTLPGLRGVLHSDVPIGAGVSSSAAVETAFVLAWEALAGLTLTGLQRAALGRQAENGYLGLQSGIMDQFASLHAAADQLILLDCRSLTHELVPLSAETTLLIADSGVRRQLVGSEYNTRRAECAAAVALLQPYLPAVRALRDVSPAQFEPVAHRLPLPVRRRAQHVVEECARVLDGAARLRQGDLAGFGRNLIPVFQHHPRGPAVLHPHLRHSRLTTYLRAERLGRTGDGVGNAAGPPFGKTPGAKSAVYLSHIMVQQHIRRAGRARSQIRADNPAGGHCPFERVRLKPLAQEIGGAHRHQLRQEVELLLA